MLAVVVCVLFFFVTVKSGISSHPCIIFYLSCDCECFEVNKNTHIPHIEKVLLAESSAFCFPLSIVI